MARRRIQKRKKNQQKNQNWKQKVIGLSKKETNSEHTPMGQIYVIWREYSENRNNDKYQ